MHAPEARWEGQSVHAPEARCEGQSVHAREAEVGGAECVRILAARTEEYASLHSTAAAGRQRMGEPGDRGRALAASAHHPGGGGGSDETLTAWRRNRDAYSLLAVRSPSRSSSLPSFALLRSVPLFPRTSLPPFPLPPFPPSLPPFRSRPSSLPSLAPFLVRLQSGSKHVSSLGSLPSPAPLAFVPAPKHVPSLWHIPSLY